MDNKKDRYLSQVQDCFAWVPLTTLSLMADFAASKSARRRFLDEVLRFLNQTEPVKG
jgi:hypothetical protein